MATVGNTLVPISAHFALLTSTEELLVSSSYYRTGTYATFGRTTSWTDSMTGTTAHYTGFSGYGNFNTAGLAVGTTIASSEGGGTTRHSTSGRIAMGETGLLTASSEEGGTRTAQRTNEGSYRTTSVGPVTSHKRTRITNATSTSSRGEWGGGWEGTPTVFDNTQSTTDYNPLTTQTIPRTTVGTKTITFGSRPTIATTTEGSVYTTNTDEALISTETTYNTTTTATNDDFEITFETRGGVTTEEVEAPVGRTTLPVLYWDEDEAVYLPKFVNGPQGRVVDFGEAYEMLPGTSYIVTRQDFVSQLADGPNATWTAPAVATFAAPRTYTRNVLESFLTSTTVQTGTETTEGPKVYQTVSDSEFSPPNGTVRATSVRTDTFQKGAGTKFFTTVFSTIEVIGNISYAAFGALRTKTITVEDSVNSKTTVEFIYSSGPQNRIVETSSQNLANAVLSYGPIVVFTGEEIESITLYPGYQVTRSLTGPNRDETRSWNAEGLGYVGTVGPSVYTPAIMNVGTASATNFLTRYADGFGITYERPGMVIQNEDMGFSNDWGLGVSMPDAHTDYINAVLSSSGFGGIGIAKATPASSNVFVTQDMQSVTYTVRSTNSNTDITEFTDSTDSFEFSHVIPWGKTYHEKLNAATICNPFTEFDPVTINVAGPFRVTSFDKTGGNSQTTNKMFLTEQISIENGAVWFFETARPNSVYVASILWRSTQTAALTGRSIVLPRT